MGIHTSTRLLLIAALTAAYTRFVLWMGQSWVLGVAAVAIAGPLLYEQWWHRKTTIHVEARRIELQGVFGLAVHLVAGCGLGWFLAGAPAVGGACLVLAAALVGIEAIGEAHLNREAHDSQR